MKVLSIFTVLLVSTLVLVSCGRDEDEELYQVSYQSASTDSIKFEDTVFTASPSTIKLGDTVRFSSSKANSDVTWVIELTQFRDDERIASKRISILADQLNPDNHYWVGGFDDVVSFDTTGSISVSVEVFKSDVPFKGGIITLKP